MIEVSAIQPGDVEAYHGRSLPAETPILFGYAVRRDGVLLGLGGVMVAGGVNWLFLDVSPEGRRHKIALHKMALRTVREAKARFEGDLFVLQNPDMPRAGLWFSRLGFAPTEQEGVWRA